MRACAADAWRSAKVLSITGRTRPDANSGRTCCSTARAIAPLSATERAQASRRGQRLDESKPGSGLGLSIVVDLAALYGGSLTLGNAPIGGLRAELVLPGV